MTRSASDREQGEVHLFCHVHMSLPWTGGSPLQNFSGGIELLAACEKLLDRLVERHSELSMSLKLPKFQQVLDSPKLRAFVQARIPFRSVVHACAMGIEGLPGLPIKKAFRIMSSSEELSQRLEKRFHCLHLRNSFNSTTMCDDLARATEAQDGKKMRSVFIVLVISTHHSTFLTFSCQRNTPGSLPDFLCGCSHYLPSGDRWRRSHADFIA